MKIVFYFSLLGILLVWGCEEPDPAFVEPIADFSTERDQFEVFEVMRITNQGQGQFYAVFPGDPGHEYAKREDGDTGFKTDVNGNFSYSYTQAGTYTLTYVVSGYRFVNGEQLETIAQKEIRITDPDIADIDINQFELGNSAINNNKYLDPVTFLFKDFRNTADSIDNVNQKISLSLYRPDRLGQISGGRYNAFTKPADVNIIPSIRLNTLSETVKIEIDGLNEFVNGQTRVIHDTQDDLRFEEKEYKLVNKEGQEKIYHVCPMIIPEFLSFELASIDANLNLFAGDYNQFSMNIDLPDGTDLSQIIPTWTLYDSDHTQVYVEGVEQFSGVNSQDFSRPITYILRYTQPKDAQDTYAGTFSTQTKIIVTVE